MLATLRAIAARAGRAAGRLGAAASRHALVTGLSATLAAGAAGFGGGFALAAHTAAVVAAPAPAPVSSPTASPTPSAAAAKTRSAAAEASRRLIALVAQDTGQTATQVRTLMGQGETLSQIAGPQAQAVVSAADAALQAKLAAMVTSGKLSQSGESTRLTRLEALVTRAMAAPGPAILKLAGAG
jgi:hypothetical protein